MKNKLLKIVTLLSLFSLPSLATDWDFLSVNGFGTIGAAYQDNENILYRDSLHADKGSKGDVSFSNYTLLGLQLDAQATDKLSFTLQALASDANSNDKLIDLEWANAKYQINNTFDIRAGLMRLPTFMFSDIKNVAYSYDTVQLSNIYGFVTISKYTGVELSHQMDIDEGYLTSTLLWGETKDTLKIVEEQNNLSNTDVEGDKIHGIVLKFLYDDLTLRGAYIKANISIDTKLMNQVLSQFTNMGIPSISEAVNQYHIDNTPISYTNIGARYDFEKSYLTAEYIEIDSSSFIPDISSWNLTYAYNFENWTPFISYSNIHTDSNYQSISSEGMPLQVSGAIAGANQTFSAIAEGWLNSQTKRISLGFRYDLSDDIALKLQYDDENSKDDLEIFSTALNFVF